MQHSTALVLFESSDDYAVVHDPVNEDWVALVGAIDEARFGVLARRYYLALSHLRSQRARPALPGSTEVAAQNRQEAFEGILEAMEQRKVARKRATAPLTPEEVFVDPLAPMRSEAALPAALGDFSVKPPALGEILGGAGRPPCDALCLLRAFLTAPLHGVGDGPTAVHQLLHSNPSFAHLCGFLGRKTLRQPFELTSRRLPSLAMCEEFSEVMTRYGLWHEARLEQVKENLATGIVETEMAIAFDTTHLEANSHCGNVVPKDAKVDDDTKPQHRKVPRMYKRCDCGEDNWETCIHAWVPTDQGAAVVVKGPTRVYWAHKASVAVFAESEIPIDVRVCLYGAENDGKTLVPHLKLLDQDFSQVIARLTHVLADDGYQGNAEGVVRFGRQARLVVPVHPRKPHAGLAEQFAGIDHFTPVGFPICTGGHRFELRGRDITGQRYIWAAPDDGEGRAVCAGCPCAAGCVMRGQRRYIRVDRHDQPQLDWDHPQLLCRDRVRYQRRTGVERAIKRLKVDLCGEHLTHRDVHRVQAHLDRKLLTLHLLLAVTASP
jgi:hypothetical protein